MDKSKTIINHPQGICTLESIQQDVNAAKEKGYSHYDFAFTYLTVQALIDKIEELYKIIPTKATNSILFDTIGQDGIVDVGNGKESVTYYFTNDDTIHCKKENGAEFYTHYKSLVM